NNTPGNGNNTPGNSSDNPKGGTDNPGNGNNNSNNGTNDPGAAGGNKKVLPKTGQETTLWLSVAGLAILVGFGSYVFLQK
ncbi:LPXTG cell wall anchor domain-containing protein, partial [Klebsiella pneumoniae]|nr:LPXTG cell wall anchor domain-containing protein [Klebsiella pneumoniae]